MPKRRCDVSQAQIAYPLTIKGELTESLSHGWWIAKWLVGYTHFIVLAALWVAAIVVTVVAFFAIVLTGKYPKNLFNFVVGVVRWTWRVGFWSYQALGTDKYPPFTLKPLVDYPADLNKEVVAVKPQPEFEPFFKINWEEFSKVMKSRGQAPSGSPARLLL